MQLSVGGVDAAGKKKQINSTHRQNGVKSDLFFEGGGKAVARKAYHGPASRMTNDGSHIESKIQLRWQRKKNCKTKFLRVNLAGFDNFPFYGRFAGFW